MTTFKCCTCKEEKPGTQIGRLTSIARIGLFTSGLLLARSLIWSTKVCKDCADPTNRTGELAFCVSAFVLIIGLLILIGAKWHSAP